MRTVATFPPPSLCRLENPEDAPAPVAPLQGLTRRLPWLAGAAGLLMLAGCATGPDFATYHATLVPPKEGEARVWFYRPSKFLGSAVQPIVFVNGEEVGKAQPGCFFFADRPSGTFEIHCTTEWADKAQLTVTTNQAHYVRLTMLPGVFVGHVLPKVVPEPQALREMGKCRLITADGRNKDWKAPAQADAPPKAPSGHVH